MPQLNAPPLTFALALRQAQVQGGGFLTSAQARQLLLQVLARPLQDGAWLLARDTTCLTAAQTTHWHAALTRLQAGEPFAYVLGQQDFYGLTLQVSPAVLIPRPDSETLIDWALALHLPAAACVLDLGTGSGALACALKAQRPQWQVHATDASPAALTVAQANAQRLGLTLHWHLGDWLQALPAHAPVFDLIISNPPYIAQHDPHLAALQHEPLSALVSGDEGLDAIRHISHAAQPYLKSGAHLLFEHGYDQAAAVTHILRTAGYSAIRSRHDLAGHTRCSGGQYLPPPTQATHGGPLPSK